MNGNSLYRRVCEYAALGDHRTGSAVDRATADWLEEQLVTCGAAVQRQTYAFDRFHAQTRLLLDGVEIPSMPLYYESIATLNRGRIAVARFADGEHGSGLDDQLENVIDAAVGAGFDALVVATEGPSGGLVAVNCEPVMRDRLPVVLAPGRHAAALEAGTVELDYRSALLPGQSSNLVARWGGDGPPFVITTPMSGWFACAGERGTGIALGLYLAERIVGRRPDLPLQLVMPGGHELGFFGAWRHQETVTGPPRAVFHLGSCIANHDADLQAIVHTGARAFDAITTALEPLSIRPRRAGDPRLAQSWVGESQCWAALGMPMLSIAGMAPRFHTPEDIAQAVTSPDLLERAADCLLLAAEALLANGGAVQS